jgi:hypothetical protein
METGERNKWIGIIIGACVMVAGPSVGYFLMDTATYMVIFLFIGGFIAGIFSPGTVKDSFRSGFTCGLIGSVIVAVPLAWVLIISVLRPAGDTFGAGMAIVFSVIFALLAMLLGSVGAVVGVIVRRIANVK